MNRLYLLNNLLLAFLLMFFAGICWANPDVSISIHKHNQNPMLIHQLEDHLFKALEAHRLFLEDHGLRGDFRPLKVQVFAKSSDFEASKKTFGARSNSSRGYYFHQEGLMVLLNDPNEVHPEIFQQTLYHEAFHHDLQSILGFHPPLWLDEGLAVLFEEAKPSFGGRFQTHALNQGALFQLKKANAASSLLDLKNLMSLNRSSFYSSNRKTHYAQAWSVVHFMLNQPELKNRRVLASILDAIQRNRSPYEAFLDSSGLSSHALDALYLDYLKLISK